MKKLLFIIKILLVIILVGLRFVWLDRFPPGLSNDEIEYVTSAKSYILQGKDISGYGLPLSLIKTETDGANALVPQIMTAPFYLFGSLNLTVARIPYVFVDLLVAIGVYFLVFTFSRNKILSLLTLISYLITPWGLFFSRNTADASFSLMFYVWGIVLLLRNNLVPSLLFFIAGFFSYHGAMPLLPFLVGLTSFYKFGSSRKTAGLIGFSLLLIFSFLLLAKNVPGSITSARNSDIDLFNTDKVAVLVNENRRMSIENPVNQFFTNKLTETAKLFMSKYFQAFSPSTLFLTGDESGTYRFGLHGLLFISDMFFIIFGLISLYRTHKKATLLLLGILFVAPLTTVINQLGTSVIKRSFMLLPILVIFTASGYYYLVKSLTRHVQIAVILGLIALTSFNFINYLHFHFFELPVISQENFWVSERVLARYFQLADIQTPVIWVVDRSRNTFLRTIFYSDKETQKQYLRGKYPFSMEDFQFKNITITTSCPEEFIPGVIYAVKRGQGDCFTDRIPHLTISEPRDAGDVFKIYGSSFCAGESTDTYRRFNYVSDYAVENLTAKDFCSRWIGLAKVKI
jgi:hypothetical protein